MLVKPAGKAVQRLGVVWDELHTGWTEVLADCTDAELAVLIRHMRCATEFGRVQIRRLHG